MEIPWTEESVFDSYEIFQETFKTVLSHDIKTNVLIPKGLRPGKYPVIYNVHGGFLVTGHGLFANLMPRWVDKLALKHSAIIISPDYRLLPSVNGVEDVLEDIEDGWQWTKSALPNILEKKAPGYEIDFSRIVLAGGSAGGFCVAQLSMSHPDEFKALAMVYPFLNPKDHVFVDGPRPDEPTILRFKHEDIPSKEATIAWINERRQVPHSREDMSATPFPVAACHHGLFHSCLFDNKGLDQKNFIPLERLDAGAQLPKTVWVMHGDDDSTVPNRCSDRFTELVHERLPSTSIRYDLVPGEDHGFEFDEKRWESFASEALDFVAKGWLEG